jgi:hypothetical protein
MASLMLSWKRASSYFTKHEESVLNDDDESNNDYEEIIVEPNTCISCDKKILNQKIIHGEQMCGCCFVESIWQGMLHSNVLSDFDEYEAFTIYACKDCDEEDFIVEDNICNRSQEISRRLYKQCMQCRQTKIISLYGDFFRSRCKYCSN